MWRHNEILKIFAETANTAPNNITNRTIYFVKQGNILRLSCINMHRSSLLDGCMDWHTTTDLEHLFEFPNEIVLMTQRPDIVIWSVKLKRFLLLS